MSHNKLSVSLALAIMLSGAPAPRLLRAQDDASPASTSTVTEKPEAAAPEATPAESTAAGTDSTKDTAADPASEVSPTAVQTASVATPATDRTAEEASTAETTGTGSAGTGSTGTGSTGTDPADEDTDGAGGKTMPADDAAKAQDSTDGAGGKTKPAQDDAKAQDSKDGEKKKDGDGTPATTTTGTKDGASGVTTPTTPKLDPKDPAAKNPEAMKAPEVTAALNRLEASKFYGNCYNCHKTTTEMNDAQRQRANSWVDDFRADPQGFAEKANAQADAGNRMDRKMLQSIGQRIDETAENGGKQEQADAKTVVDAINARSGITDADNKRFRDLKQSVEVSPLSRRALDLPPGTEKQLEAEAVDQGYTRQDLQRWMQGETTAPLRTSKK